MSDNNPAEVTRLLDDHSRSTGSTRDRVLAAYQNAFRSIFLVGASLSAISFVVVLFLMPQSDLDRPNDISLKEKGRRQDLSGTGEQTGQV